MIAVIGGDGRVHQLAKYPGVATYEADEKSAARLRGPRPDTRDIDKPVGGIGAAGNTPPIALLPARPAPGDAIERVAACGADYAEALLARARATEEAARALAALSAAEARLAVAERTVETTHASLLDEVKRVIGK